MALYNGWRTLLAGFPGQNAFTHHRNAGFKQLAESQSTFTKPNNQSKVATIVLLTASVTFLLNTEKHSQTT